MKICVVTTVSKIMDWFVVDTMKYFYKMGAEVTLVCDMDDEFIERNSEYANCIPVPMQRGVAPVAMLKTLKILINLFKKEKYDIIQYSAPAAALCAAIAGKIAGIKVRIYCQWGVRYVGYEGWRRFVLKGFEKMICLFSTHVQPDSKGNLHFGIQERLYKPEKASVVWNGSACGINMDKFCMDKKQEWNEEIRREYKIAEDDFVFGFVGRITRDKGIQELVAAYEMLSADFPKCKLMLVGDHEEIETLNQETRECLFGNPKIILTGRVPDAEKYLATMNTFILPSYREGFGSVVIEAAAMGLPIIISNIPGPTDVIVHGTNGLIVPKKNVPLLYEAMMELMNSKDMCEHLGENAYHTVLNGFEQKQMFEHIYEDRKRLLGFNEK